MTIAEIQQEIMRMKKEQDICILAHAYQGQEILEVADYILAIAPTGVALED